MSQRPVPRLKGSSSLLMVVRKYIGDGIKKRIDLILEIWELAQSSTTFSTRVFHFKEYLQKYLENDEGFYKEAVGTFAVKVSSLSETHRREQNLPSKVHMKQINACWLKRIKCLRELLSECDTINIKRGDIFLKLVDLTKELDGPHLIMDTILLSREKLLEQLEALKVAWANEFSDSIEFSEEEIERWLVWYVNKNDDIEDTLHQLSIDLRELENELFETKTKHEITVSPMREYIEQWLTKALVKITETDQQEVVTSVMPPPTQQQQPTKDATTRK
jgi:hypothetical protein